MDCQPLDFIRELRETVYSRLNGSPELYKQHQL